MPERRIVLIAGPTASGKSALAVEAAERLGGEVVSVDATSVYRGLDIGSAKPDAAQRRRAAHHVVDVADPRETYTLGRFLVDARAAVGRIEGAGRTVVLAGGTGLYARALVEGWRPPPPPDPTVREMLRHRLEREGPQALWRELWRRDPVWAARLHPNDRTRIVRALERLEGGAADADDTRPDPALSLVDRIEAIVLDVSRAQIEPRVEARTRAQFAEGLLEETLSLLGRGVDPAAGSLRSIGYRSAVSWALGRLTIEEARRETVRDTLLLAKRQRTWWRSVPWVRLLGAEEAHRRLLHDGPPEPGV